MKKITYFIIGTALALTSCKKYVDIGSPIDSFEANLAFSNDELAKADIAGLYSYNLVMAAYHDTYRLIFPGFTSDELEYFNNAFEEFTNNQILVTNANNIQMWGMPYTAIYQCNMFLDALEKNATRLSDPVKKEAESVAKFFRALSYLNMVTIYGDVPLVLTPDEKEAAIIPRTPVAEIYAQIIKDLEDAKSLLKNISKSKFYVTEQAATALLARVSLYNAQWDKAAAYAEEIISGPLKGSLILEDVQKVFLRTSRESIFASSTEGSNRQVVNHTYVGRTFIHNGVRVVYPLTNSLVNTFEEGDLRKTNWTAFFNGGVPKWYANKYKLNRIPTDGSQAEDQVLLRLGEVYLIRAEANAQLDKLTASIEDLNAIRKRAGLQELAATLTKNQVLLAVEQERRVELFLEYGHRWVDLNRTGRADAVLGALKPTWKSHAKYYPIPERQIELNPRLIQNPGYDQ